MVNSSGQLLLLHLVGPVARLWSTGGGSRRQAVRAPWHEARGSKALPNGLGHGAATRHAHAFQDQPQVCIEKTVHGLEFIHVAQTREDCHALLVLIGRIRG
eukprot:11219416-Lingulodinium_polyedra.AAC.2